MAEELALSTVTSSRFLDYIDPRDHVLADRGFPVCEELLVKQVELGLPPARKGVSQMTSYKVEQTKKVANVRIHVERVIHRLKHFRYLSPVIFINMLKHANNILLVCAAITNMQRLIVKSWKASDDQLLTCVFLHYYGSYHHISITF